jgi:hypothetical protein
MKFAKYRRSDARGSGVFVLFRAMVSKNLEDGPRGIQ